MSRRIIIICGLIILVGYTILGLLLPDSWQQTYSSENFDLRTVNGLPKLDDSYQLDTFSVNEEGVIVESWKLISGEEPSQPFHYRKIFYYSSSFWLWENEFLGEFNDYRIPISDEKEMLLKSFYDSENDSIEYSYNLSYTDFGIEQKRMRDIVSAAQAIELNEYLCGTTLLEPEMLEINYITRTEFESIINHWDHILSE